VSGTVSDVGSASDDRSTRDPAIRVVLADDHAVVRSALRVLLDSHDGIEVVAEARDARDAALQVSEHHPDVLVLDLKMPGEPSVAAIPRILQEAPGTQIVVLTMQLEPRFARQALGAGAIAYVLKDAAARELVHAIRLASRGEAYLDPGLAARVAAAPHSAPAGLTPRENDVLELIAAGYTNQEAAAQLLVSERTVEKHRSEIFRKLHLATRAELVAYVREQGGLAAT